MRSISPPGTLVDAVREATRNLSIEYPAFGLDTAFKVELTSADYDPPHRTIAISPNMTRCRASVTAADSFPSSRVSGLALSLPWRMRSPPIPRRSAAGSSTTARPPKSRCR